MTPALVLPLFRTTTLPLALLLLLLLLQTTTITTAEKDSNVYPWGTNPNTHFKMYWKDAANVVQDLSEFQALYITVHGCVWSECGVDNFDDDGENHDGDENWYQTRTDTFCANAAFSLFGIRKHNIKFINTCSKGTYINSFFTYGGADTLAKALNLNINTKDGNRYSTADDDSYATSNHDCVAIDSSGRRFLEDQDKDNDNNDYYSNSGMSTTMGCAAQTGSKYNKFVLAAFNGEYCEGQNYVETLDTLNSYNKGMNKVKCHKIFDLGNYNRQQKANSYNNNNNNNNNANNRDLQAIEQLIVNSIRRNGHDDHDMDSMIQDELMELEADNHDDMILQQEDERQLNENNNNNQNNGYNQRTYDSVAEKLLYHSWACDLSLYPNACPDPYGLKRKYADVMLAASKGQPIAIAVLNAKLRKPLKILTWAFSAIGIYLLIFAYYVKNKAFVQANGGGGKGFGALLKRDTMAMGVAVKSGVAKARKDMSDKNNKKKTKKRRSRAAGLAGVFGLGAAASSSRRSSRKKKRRSKSKSLKRTPSGKSIPPEEDAVTQYSEMTDGEYASTLSPTSVRTSKAAEAAFAAAAQFDLEQQQLQQQSQTHGTIQPPSTKSSRGRGGSDRKSSSSSRSKSQRGLDPSPMRKSSKKGEFA